MENKLELKKRLKHEKLEIIESKRKIKENISAEVNKISLISREEMDNIQELNAKGENNDSSKEKITKLKNSIEKLKKEIQEKEEIIRKKVLDSVFNNYKSIIGVPGGDIFIGKVLGEEFIVKELVDDWMERRFSLEETSEWINAGFQMTEADFCAWIRDIKKLTIEQSFNYGIGELVSEYCDQLGKESDIFSQYSKKLGQKEKNLSNELFADFQEYLFNIKPNLDIIKFLLFTLA